MPNITLSIDKDTYRAARIWCLEHDTCVSHVVKTFLQDLLRHDTPGTPDPHSLAALFEVANAEELELMRDADAWK